LTKNEITETDFSFSHFGRVETQGFNATRAPAALLPKCKVKNVIPSKPKVTKTHFMLKIIIKAAGWRRQNSIF
jgi:hypothetical protein